VSDQQDLSDNVALSRHVEELQEALEQVRKGIAALAAGQWTGCTTQLDAAAAAVGSALGTSGKKSMSRLWEDRACHYVPRPQDRSILDL